jgi:hypothetical protein
LNLERSIVNFEKKLNRVDPVPGTRNKSGLTSWKGRQIIPFDDWFRLRDTPYALGCFPDDFDQTLTYLELPYYQYEFERKKGRLETKRRSDGWLNDKVGYGAICHDSRGNLIDGLGNQIREEWVEEGKQKGDKELKLKQEDIEQWHSDYIELLEYTKNPNYGRLKCFHCLLSLAWNDPIFIGINRLVAKGLTIGEQESEPIRYPCQILLMMFFHENKGFG